MSMTGSLMGYENNNDVNQTKCKKPIKSLPAISSVNSSGVTTSLAKTSTNSLNRNGRSSMSSSSGRSGRSYRSSHQRNKCGRGHVNSLWSVWYGIIAVAFQAYIAMRCTKRFMAYLSLPWPADDPPPKFELHACLALAGAGVLLLPILLAAAFLKVGNLANDGIKLGRQMSTCSRDPPSALITGSSESGLINNLWRHGGPTAAFVHLCTAMCFLLPSLLMEARMIHAGFLPKEIIWRTDLDWILVHQDRLVVLSFMNPHGNLSLSRTQFHSNNSSSFYFDTDDDQHDFNRNNESSPSSFDGSSSSSSTSDTADASPSKLSTILLPSSTAKHDFSTSQTDISSSTFDSSEETDQYYNQNDPEPTLPPSTTSTTTTTTTTTTTPATTTMRRQQKRTHNQKNQKNRLAGTKNSRALRGKNTFLSNMTAQSLPLTLNSLADLDHPESLNLDYHNDSKDYYGPITLEYLNYAMALGVYSVRYPSVFWASNKALGTIFSIQLVANTIQSLLAYTGMSVLYKIQVVGPLKVLPILRHRTIVPPGSTLSAILGDRILLLDPHVTLALFGLATLLVLCSSMVMYTYAYGRFVAFLNRERDRRIILPKEIRDDSGWGYMTHSAALCLFLAIGICSAPLVYDYVMVYRGSLDGAILACVIATVLHLFLWLVLWIFLTVKQNWIFKLRITIAKASLRSARSIKLVTDLDLINSNHRASSAKDDDEASTTPLLIVGNGRTYTVSDTSPKKAIMGVVQKAAMERRARAHGGSIDNGDCDSGDGEEQIYWLRPKLRPSPVQSSGDGNGSQGNEKGWLNKKLKQKVTFNDLPSTSGSRNKGKARRGTANGGPDDDGDYATLRELPLVTTLDPADDTTSEENKQWGAWMSSRREVIPTFMDQLLECVNDDQVTYYASGNRDLQPSEGEPSPELTPIPLSNDPITAEVLPLPPPSPTSVPVASEVSLTNSSQLNSTGSTPRCLRRADSGMVGELTPRSDSSHSPPLDVCNGSNGHNSNTSSHSETSSGVHSNASNGSGSQRRASSVEDITSEPREEPQWRSCSLQRGTQPPTAALAAKYTTVYNGVAEPIITGCSSVILENPDESTVVIRRRSSRTKLQDSTLDEEPFGRSTNMRMTSFTEHGDFRGVQPTSATLPHYPTQPVNAITYPRCSTMPLPHPSHNGTPVTNVSGASGGSCGSVRPRQPATPPQIHHTTLPSHHNGLRLLLHGQANPFTRRFPVAQIHTQPWPQLSSNGGGHHTFSQVSLLQQAKIQQQAPVAQVVRQSDRDSANFSMASSGDSDTCLPH